MQDYRNIASYFLMPEAKLNILFSEYYLLIIFLIFLGNHFNTQTMAPLSNAEKCRRYQEKHREEYCKTDALRKKHKIALMKVKDLKANELRLKLQREKKRAYRKRMNESKENQISNSAEFSFSNKSVKCRSLTKVLNALLKSPNKRNEIAQSLSQKFNLRIALNSKKLGRPENYLSEDKVEWLCQFMDRPDITYTHPGKKDQ